MGVELSKSKLGLIQLVKSLLITVFPRSVARYGGSIGAAASYASST